MSDRTSMSAEYFAIDNGGERQESEQAVQQSPEIFAGGLGSASARADGEEAVRVLCLPVRVGEFVVAAEEVDLPRVQHLEAEQVSHQLQGVWPAVHKVALWE